MIRKTAFALGLCVVATSVSAQQLPLAVPDDHLEEGMPTGFLSPGWSFGLGFTVKTEAGLDGLPSSVGEYNWIGIQGTSFWVDPEEDLVGVFMVQIRPNRDITFRDQFKRLVYQALIG